MISRNAPVAQLRTNLSLSEFDLSTLYEFFVTPEKIEAACSLVNFGNAVSASVDRTKREPTFEIAPAFVLAVFRRLCDYTRKNEWRCVDPASDPREGLWEHCTYESQESIADHVLVSVDTVQRALRVLSLMGLVHVAHHQIGRMRTRNVNWVRFSNAQLEFARNEKHKKAARARQVVDEYENEFAPARGHTVQEAEAEKMRKEEAARLKLAKRGQFIKPPCLNISKPDYATQVRPLLRSTYEGTPEAIEAARMAERVGIGQNFATLYAIHSPSVLVELCLYAKKNLKRAEMHAGYVAKHFQRFVVGLSYGEDENKSRWTKSAQSRIMTDIKRGRLRDCGGLIGGAN